LCIFQALFFLDRALEIATASSPLKLLRAECLAYLGRNLEAQVKIKSNGISILKDLLSWLLAF